MASERIFVKVQAPFQPEGGAYSGHGRYHNHDENGHPHTG
jgi:hypothetical protein